MFGIGPFFGGSDHSKNSNNSKGNLILSFASQSWHNFDHDGWAPSIQAWEYESRSFERSTQTFFRPVNDNPIY